ncbi:cytoplasmic dynein 2 intermediate chain 1 isoform X2 [Labeo rohita]|uniref:cytoplasmic dynein 2 intermediate chain 1 isoform X2 n=1 Tax=Labeo rohita TaxID=84645 RepID=UPI0021E2CAB2|nr:cytoplasmic dynein 2 intermediate chain 1 isoform X2 [Labeo rohita]
MYPVKAHNEESKRRSKREEEHRKYRDGESLDRRHRDPDRDARSEKEKEKLRERESTKERSKHRDPDRDRNQDIKGEDIKEDRYKERKRERERENRHRDGDEEEKRHNRAEKENSERRRDREKDRYKDRDIDMYNQGDRGTSREREKDRDRRRAERDRERRNETDRRKERREGEKEERERNKDRDRERKSEMDKRKEPEKEEGERDKERERRERHRARESEQNRHEYEEKHRDGERRERRGEKEHSGHKEKEHRRDREDREKRRRDKESHVPNTSHSREAEEHAQEWKVSKDYFHGIKDGDREKAREREERDRRRERRHKEASDSKRSDRERKHKDSSSHDLNERINRDKEEPNKIPQVTWRSIQAEISDPENPVENEEAEEDKQSSKDYHNDYEEDFEDYEEDFEDVGEEDDDNEEEEKEEHDNKAREGKRELSPKRREEIEAIQKAIDEENERIYSARSKPTTTESAVTQRERHSDRSQTHGKIIDFVSAKQREISQKVAKKQKQRSEELLRLIDLDFSITFSLLDLPPVNEYDMYIKNFGTANTKQAYVQCNEDNTDRDIQTEEVEMTDRWTQHPPEANAACGGSKASQDTADESTLRININSQRLTTFLHSAAQVMAVLIEENMAESNSVRRLRSQTDALSFSDGCIQLNTKLPFLHGRKVSLLQFSQVQRHTLLSVHPPSSKNSAVRLDGETIICVWNIWEPSRPQKILLYESEVKCCCFSPGKVTLVFAGTEVGSVVVWDLREHSGTHLNLVVGKEVWTLRYPTFSTDAVLSGVGHLSPVVSIEPVVATADTSSKSATADIDESLGLSFQLGSLDENGVLTLWVVVELPKGNESGSQTDLGLRPGGKVKLLHSSSLQTTEKSPQDVIMGFGPPVSLQLKFLPSDSNHYFIGTNMGLVRHGTRHSLKVLPKFYRSQFDSCRPVEVTALDFSPSGEPLFLVGCSDGTVRLHSVLREDPLMEWSGCSSGAPVLSVQWSQTRPAVFCVLDAASDLHIWDLTVKDYVPVVTENIHNDRVIAMAVFGEPAKQNTFSGVALAKQSGKVEIQYFKESLTVPSPDDKEKLDSFLHNAFLM